LVVRDEIAVFATYDQRLAEAAAAEGFDVVSPS
jgi:predicted alpha/beta hydrolase